MKKTIAKIMAAAMVLSTMAVPTANAADQGKIVKNFTLTDGNGTKYEVIKDGVAGSIGTIDVPVTSDDLIYNTAENIPQYTIDTDLTASADLVDVTDDIEYSILGNSAFYATYVGAMRTFVANGTGKVNTDAAVTSVEAASKSVDATKVIIGGDTFYIPAKDSKYDDSTKVAKEAELTALKANLRGLDDLKQRASNSANKAAAKKAYKSISEAMAPVVAQMATKVASTTDISNYFGNWKTNDDGKTVVGKDLVSNAFLEVKATGNDGINLVYNESNGHLRIVFPQTQTWANRVANLNSEAISIPVTVTSGTLNEIEAKFTLKLGGAITVADDAYWNAFVKLKASNNRYIPIRVHVDVVDGTRYQFLGLYAEIRNGSVIAWRDNNGRRTEVSSVDSVSAGSWINNRLQIQDVETVGLDVLRSDVAKGKNLMLDEAYIFNVYDINNVANWDWTSNPDIAFYDWATSNVYTDIATVSVGKIQDIRSGLFKKCKEKLVHAKNVKWIRNGAFRENKQLKKAILSDDVSMKKINEKSFYKCKKLNTVKVKVNTLKHVGKNAFGDSTDKKSLKFNLKAGSKAKYNKAVKLFKKSGVKKAKFRKI